MKKIFVIMFVITIIFVFSSCGSTSSDDPVQPIDDPVQPETLVNPTIEWWEVYNPNGYNTFTASLYNPNSSTIDVNYELVFYKNGSEIARLEDLSNQNIASKQSDLIWVNYDVPKKDDFDEVKMENIHVSKSYSTPINGSCTFVEHKENKAYFNFKFDKEVTLATISFVLYNDLNSNKKYDSGEIVVVHFETLLSVKEGSITFNKPSYSYTDYMIFINAY